MEEKEKQIDFKAVELLTNLQMDINNIIMNKSIKELTKNKNINIELIDSIKDSINNTLKEYLNYYINK